MLICILLPAWLASGASYLSDVLGQMVSPLLLPALGVALVMQRRRLDLSVWVTYALGSAVAARMLPDHVALAVVTVLAVGLAVGLVNAVLVAGLKLPCWPVTLLVATLGAIAFRFLTGGREIALAKPCHLIEWATVSQPVALTGIAYIAALLLGLLASGERAQRKGYLLALGSTLVLSSVLSAWGGLCWFIHLGVTPMRAEVVGDLRVAAAAVLCGAVVMRGLGRALLAAAMLPVALLACTIWRQMVWDVPGLPWPVQLLLLIPVVLAMQVVLLKTADALGWSPAGRQQDHDGPGEGTARPDRGRMIVLATASLLMLAGLGLAAYSAYPLSRPMLRQVRWAGVGLWIIGGVLAAWKIFQDFRRTAEKI
jgi:ribose/xylose/arabinose/galactoside ABC-type transport system permease subunit